MIKDKEITHSVTSDDFKGIVDTGVCTINDKITVHLTNSEIEKLSWGETVQFVESGYVIKLTLHPCLGKEQVFSILKGATYKSNLISIASDTLEVIKTGNCNGKDILDDISNMVDNSSYHPDYSFFSTGDLKFGGTYNLEVMSGTTIEAILRLHRKGKDRICVLNFASAKKPGGGFINGAIAQEESLARSSALYQSLIQFPDFYQGNQAPLYTPKMIYSPNVPFFKDDRGSYLPEPVKASVITCAAPNLTGLGGDEFAVYVGWQRNDVLKNRLLGTLHEVFVHRIYNILKLAYDKREENLILGAWGCGVFKNDPKLVASYFKEVIASEFLGKFESITFAIYDTTGNIIGHFK